MKMNNRLFWFAFLITAIALFYAGYFHALSSPFYFDDLHTITENNKIIASANVWEYINALSWRRSLADISFYLNAQHAGSSTEGFRSVNYILHFINFILVAWFVFRISKKNIFLSATTSLLFLIHPIQIQSVTYIAQRYNELATLFMLLALIFTTKTLAVTRSKSVWAYAFLTALFSALALLSKENALVLAFLIPLTAYCVQPKAHPNLAFARLSWLTILLVIVSSFLIVVLIGSELSSTIDSLTRTTAEFTRLDYFLAQGPVLLNYLGKLFYPSPLYFDYTWTVQSFSSLELWLAWLVHVVLVGMAIITLRKPEFRLIGFGILFYYLGLMVESSVIPIDDIGFEHRNYLPMVGISIAVTALVQKILGNKYSIVIATIAIVALTYVTHERNSDWSDKQRFVEHELDTNPKNPWVLNELAKIHIDNEEYFKALDVQQEVLNITEGKVDEAFLFNFWYSLLFTGYLDTADDVKATLASKYRKLAPQNKYRYHVYSAMLWRARRQEDKAVEECQKARQFYRNLFENLCSY